MDEEYEAPRFSIRDLVINYLSTFGWIILLILLLIYQAYHRFLRPHLDAIREADEVANRKKFDDNVHAKVAERMALARAKQQEEHDKVAAELELQRQEREAEKLRKLQEEMEKESVLASALGTHMTNELLGPREKKAAEESPAEFILRMVAAAPVVIFSKSFCPFCRNAKAAFAVHRLSKSELIYVELDEMEEKRGEAVRAGMERLFGSRILPKVFIGGDQIGDQEEVTRLQRDGILEVLVQDAVTMHRREQGDN